MNKKRKWNGFLLLLHVTQKSVRGFALVNFFFLLIWHGFICESSLNKKIQRFKHIYKKNNMWQRFHNPSDYCVENKTWHVTHWMRHRLFPWLSMCFVLLFFFSFQCFFFFMLMYVHQSIGRPRVGDWTHWCRTETVNATFSKRSKLCGGGGRMDLRADPFSKQPLQLNLSLNTGIGVRCLPGAYSSARTLLKTRCARLKTDPWSNNF